MADDGKMTGAQDRDQEPADPAPERRRHQRRRLRLDHSVQPRTSTSTPSNYNATWIDWTDWEAAPTGSTPDMSVGPGDNCPFSSCDDGFAARRRRPARRRPARFRRAAPTTATSARARTTAPAATTTAATTARPTAHSAARATCTGHSNCSCSGSGSNKTATNSGYYEHTWIANNHNTWNGCVTDRGDSRARRARQLRPERHGTDHRQHRDAVPGRAVRLLPDAAVMGLSYNWTTMNTLVNGMTPERQHQPGDRACAGLAVAGRRRTVHRRRPMDPNYTYTAGHHPADRRPEHAGPLVHRARRSIDSARRRLTCANIKAAGITLYTIQVNTGGDPTSTLLQNCAQPTAEQVLHAHLGEPDRHHVQRRSAPTCRSCASPSKRAQPDDESPANCRACSLPTPHNKKPGQTAGLSIR